MTATATATAVLGICSSSRWKHQGNLQVTPLFIYCNSILCYLAAVEDLQKQEGPR